MQVPRRAESHSRAARYPNTNTTDDCSIDNFGQHRPTSSSTYDPRTRIRPQSWTPCATPRTGDISNTPSRERPTTRDCNERRYLSADSVETAASKLGQRTRDHRQEDDELSSCPTGSKHYEGVVMAGSPARVDDEDADGRGQEATTAAPATMALRTRASERGLRHSPEMKSSATRTPAVCSSEHDCTDAFKPRRGAARGLSTEASAKKDLRHRGAGR